MSNFWGFLKKVCVSACGVALLSACAPVDVPGAHSVDVPAAAKAKQDFKPFNEDNIGVTRLTLGSDVLVPKPLNGDPLPDIYVGPFELRAETLAGALQLILADLDISLAFESERGLTERITVANLSGRLPRVIERICGLADLYCGYEEGLLTVKNTETFVVDLPPIGDETAFDEIAEGLTEILDGGSSTSSNDDDDGGDDDDSGDDGGDAEPVVDLTTRVIVYQASNRTSKRAEEYFRRLRKNTALIVFETNIWEVTLNNANRTGINWDAALGNLGNFDLDISIAGNNATGGATPITITPGFNGSGDFTSTQVFNFISERGAVKTVSQPQLTVLSGSQATLSVNRSENFVSEVTRTVDENGDDNFATTTDTVDTGLTLDIASAWDESTIYGTIDISIDELINLENFPTADGGTIQLPETTSRALTTQVRVRPGDAVIIAGLVSETDNFSGSGPGFLKPLFNTSRASLTDNSELVFMLRPRVIIFDPVDEPRGMQTSQRPVREIQMDQGAGGLTPEAMAPVSMAPQRRSTYGYDGTRNGNRIR